ncbi:MAG TPA: methylated-DNA--[protein]-cysteine S-methyltransferase [Acidimicrobiales bacterium]|nr:methylated-DNA--[protein]-cysteine S-methyltransferase [Acidimicrobiales bacterium]
MESPLGPLLLEAAHGALRAVRYVPGAAPAPPPAGRQPRPREDAAVLDRAAHQLEEYFAGRRRRFTVPLAPAGTPFQRRVWDALGTLPYGTTVSYGRLARLVDRPGAARAVGHANARNPLAVVVPCHRVVGSSGALTGYGGGLDAKRFLLELEAGRAAPGPRP